MGVAYIAIFATGFLIAGAMAQNSSTSRSVSAVLLGVAALLYAVVATTVEYPALAFITAVAAVMAACWAAFLAYRQLA